MSFFDDILFCLKPRCPMCQRGRLFDPLSISVVEKCDTCGEKLSDHDVGDAAAVFVMWILAFTVVPLALVFEYFIGWPVWLHAVVWGGVGLAMVLVLLPLSKAYIILLEYRHLKPK